MNEATDIAAGLVIQVGNYLKIKKNAKGWLLSMAAILYWVIRAKETGFQGQMFWHLVSFLIAFQGFYQWRANETV